MPRSRYRVTCDLCKASFNNDYISKHCKAKHPKFTKATLPLQKDAKQRTLFDFGRPESASPEAVPTSDDDEATAASLTDVNTSGDAEDAVTDQPDRMDVDAVSTAAEASFESTDTVEPPRKRQRNDDSNDSHSSSPEDGDDATDDVADDEDDDGSLGWVSCFGKLRHLVSTLRECDQLDTKITEANSPNQIDSLLELLDVVDRVALLSSALTVEAQETLAKIEESAREANPDDYQITLMERDPANRRPVTCDADRINLIAAGPFQPKLRHYPSDMDEGHNHHFNSAWFQMYPHLEYSTEKNAAFCFVCQLFAKDKSQDPWTKTGVQNWKKMRSQGKKKPGKLVQHFSSDAHKRCLEQLADFQNTNSHIDVCLSREVRNQRVQEQSDIQRNRAAIKTLLDISRTLSRQGLAFRGVSDEGGESGNFQQLTNLVARHNSSFQKWLDDSPKRPHGAKYLSPRSQNDFIKLLGDDVSTRIVAEIEESGVFAVIADTTPDTSHKDQLSVVARFSKLGEQHAKERLVGFKDIDDKTGDGQALAILSVIDQSNLDRKSIAFQSYDYTASMSGVFKGCQAKIKEHLDRDVPYIPCLAHRINTAVEHSCDASHVIANLFDIVQEIFNFFSSSTKRYGIYKENVSRFQAETTTTILLLRNLSRTRWVAREESLQAIWSSYEPLLSTFAELQQDDYDAKTRLKARCLRDKIQTLEFLVCLMFMRHVMTKSSILTTEVQGTDINVISTLESVEAAIASLKSIRTDEANMNREIEASLHVAQEYGVDGEAEFKRRHHRRKVPKRLDDRPETAVELNLYTFYRKEFIVVIESQVTALQDNLDVATSIVKPVANLVKPPYDSCLKHDDVERAANLLPVELQPDVDVLTSEVSSFRTHIKNNNPQIQTIEEATEYISSRGWLFPLTQRCFQLLHTIPITSASSERSFSKLKLIKTLLRSVMSQERLKDLLILACERDLTDNIDLDKLADQWANSTKAGKGRRMKISQKGL